MPLSTQVVWLFVLALPIACIAWTVTHEEVFREPREYCEQRSEDGQTMLERKTGSVTPFVARSQK